MNRYFLELQKKHLFKNYKKNIINKKHLFITTYFIILPSLQRKNEVLNT